MLTRDNLRRYAGHTAWIFANQVFCGFATLILSILVSRYVDKNIYGTYKYITATVAMIGMVSLSGVNIAIMRKAAHNYQAALLVGSKQYWRYSWIAVLLSFILAFYYGIHGNWLFAGLIGLGGLLYPAFFISQNYNGYLSALKKFRLATIYNSSASILATATLAVVVILAPQVAPLTIAYFLGNIIFHGWFFWLTIKKHDQTENPEDNKAIVDQAKHNSINNLIGAGVANLDKLLVFQLVGAAPLAIYTFATTIPDFFKSFTKSINMVFFPAISNQRSISSLKTISLINVLAVLLTASAIASIYSLLAKPLFIWLYPNYIEAANYSAFYGATIVSGAIILSITNIIQARSHTRLTYRANIDSSIIQLVCLVVIAGIYQTIGGIIAARLIGQILGSGWLAWLLWREHKKK